MYGFPPLWRQPLTDPPTDPPSIADRGCATSVGMGGGAASVGILVGRDCSAA